MQCTRASRRSATRWRFATLAAAICTVLVVAGAGSAAIVETGYTGSIDEIDATLAAALPPGSAIYVGAPVIVNYAYESTTPDTDPDPTSGIYTGAITSFTFYIGTQVFEHEVGGPVNEIDVLFDSLLNIYQPVDSVVASPPLPIAATLEGDVIFFAANESPLTDDSLIPPPAPGDPGWASAEAAITDDMSNLLINVVLETQCAGGCPPPTAAPVPATPRALLVLAFAFVGAWAMRSRQDARPMPTG